VDNRILRAGAAVAGLLGAVILAYVAFSRPGYFTSATYIGGLLMLEVLAAAVWLYRRAFFAIIIVTFLFAGMDLPLGGGWTMARWGVLGLGALVGVAIVLKEHRYSFGMFHILAFLTVLSALMSAAVSRYTSLSSLKVLSLVLLFLYSATGARLAVAGRESRFFTGLLLGCEIFVGAMAGFYFIGIEAMGNPNSLGAVMGVVAAPILLWGVLLKESAFAHRRHLLFYGLAMYLTYLSHARAAMAAAFVVCTALCICLRRYMLLAEGITILAIVVAAAAILQPDAFSRTLTAINTDVVYKGKDVSEGLLGSRKSPWQETKEAIREHYWFGSGFGTSDTGQDPTDNLGKFASSSLTSKEYGSSYLEIIAWVGVLGSVPFFVLVVVLLAKVLRSMVWMFRSASPYHPVVPLAMVLLAGLLHATFEDWLFAPGYYLCVFFWCMAFVFIDQLDRLPVSRRGTVPWIPAPSAATDFSVVAPSR
jgi:hypothetical protein